MSKKSGLYIRVKDGNYEVKANIKSMTSKQKVTDFLNGKGAEIYEFISSASQSHMIGIRETSDAEVSAFTGASIEEARTWMVLFFNMSFEVSNFNEWRVSFRAMDYIKTMQGSHGEVKHYSLHRLPMTKKTSSVSEPKARRR